MASTQHQLNQFWYRRASEAMLFMSLAIVVLALNTLLEPLGSVGSEYAVPFVPGVMAAVTFAFTLVFYFAAPRTAMRRAAMASYALLLATTVIAVQQNGLENSLLLGLVVALMPFTTFFGAMGTLLGLAAYAALIAISFFTETTSTSYLIALSIVTGIPLVASIVMWSRVAKSAQETAEDKSYNELASELSQVAGKSEVVINAITDGVLALDGKGTIQLINPAAQKLLGWGKGDSLNLSYKSVLKIINIKNEVVGDAQDPVAQALANNKPLNTDQLSIQTQSGKNFIASISVSPVGQLGNGVIVVFRDITAEKSDERQRAEFISTASHEMRTPVASIEGYLGLTLNPNTATIDEKARDFITKAHESAQHLGRLFQDLLDVSKADDGRLQNNPTIVDVVPFVGEIVESLTPKATEKGLHILFKPMPGGAKEEENSDRKLNPVYYVNVDRDHLREVTDNLIENAIKYTPKGDVVVDITGDQAHVTISVQDTGIGIPAEDQTHLFQKFYRVDNSDTREIGGTGLGLYLCRRLAETMGGRIWLESEYKKGSTFFVELPRIDHDEAQQLIEKASIAAEQAAEREAQDEPKMAPPDQPRPRDNAGEPSAEETTQPAEAAEPAPTQATPPSPQPAEPAAPQGVSTAPITQPSAPAPVPPAQTTPSTEVAPAVPVQAPPAAPAPPENDYIPRPMGPNHPNTPLTSIEATPGEYTTRRQQVNVVVPPRDQKT